ncbi:putative transposase Ptta/En/Spm plant [Arabidopsis thaliana x Arabidopsis arenosa]|uniref:Putative transposase Ptta/En/Spm plant n=1 Tax=Arabidopsis thaliana x Arabidopsis arenosa TaxID=1240361 RepID=A0A8T2BJ54_9BRAS|nr:putative transposase Ptta/En/Spm plant [Arabidopsis thaliana x Arabidopsis arenosa]
MVNFSRLIHSRNGEEDEPYVLASQARLVYYVEDPQEKGWSVVVHVQPRDLYDMGDHSVSDDMPPEIIIEDPPVQSSIISNNVSNIRLVRPLEDLENSEIPCDLYDNMEVFCWFWFDDPRRRRKYTLSALGGRCRDLKQRLWKKYRRNTLEESFDVRPGLIPEDQWKEFVEMQFSDKAKEEVSGIEPNRAELFIASRTKSDGSLVCNEDKLSRVMSQNIQNEAPSNESRPNDVFEQVFGPEHPGRVRCAGHGTTPFNTNLHQSSSVSSDQESNISKTGI